MPPHLSSSSRPKLASRAITDFGPLSNPLSTRTPHQKVHDLGQGTQLSSAGRKLASGTRLPGGEARAPVTPFLPLPPAPTADEILAITQDGQDGQDAIRTPTPTSPLRSFHFRKLGNEGQSKRTGAETKKDPIATVGAMGMIRSYSLPVPTQREFDQQCRAFAEREANEPECHSFLWSSGWPGSADCLGPSRFKKRLHVENGSGRIPSASSSSSSGSSSSGARTPRSPLSPLPSNMGTSIRALSSSSLRMPSFQSSQQPTSHLAIQVFDDTDDLSSSDTDEAPAADGRERDRDREREAAGPHLAAVDECVEEVEELSSDSMDTSCEQDVAGCYFAPRSTSQDRSARLSSSSLGEEEEEEEHGPVTPKASTPTSAAAAAACHDLVAFTPLPPIGMEHSFSSRFRQRGGQDLEVAAAVWVGGRGRKDGGFESQMEGLRGTGTGTGTLEDFIHPDHLAPPPALAL